MEEIKPIEDALIRPPLKPPKGLFQKRYILTVYLFLATFCVMLHRVGLSVAIVAMVNQTDVITAASSGARNTSDSCSTEDRDYSPNANHGGKFQWDKRTQGLILGSFFYGYIPLQVFGGWLAARFSAKWTIGIALSMNGVLELCIPFASGVSFILLMVVRSLQGLLQGVIYPSMSALMAVWFPMQEMVWLSTLRMMGASLGLVFGQLLAGFLCDKVGWQSVFYCYGALTILWFMSWNFFVFERPSQHPTITDGERNYLESHIGARRSKSLSIPWLKMLKSPCVYASMSTFMAFDWFQFTLLTSLPQFMNDVLRFALTENGLLSSLPFIAFTFLMLCTSKCIDRLSRGRATCVRKLVITLGFSVTSIFLFSLRYIGCNRSAAVSFIVVGYAFQGFVQMIVSVAPMDLSRQHAGVLHGLCNTFSAISGASAPFVVGILTQEAATKDQWMIVFYICCAVGMSANFIYLLFGSAERQPWDIETTENTENAIT